MLLTAELLLYYQRCSRRAFLDIYGDITQRDLPSDYLLKLRRDSLKHQHQILSEQTWHKPEYPEGNWQAGLEATVALMRQGVDLIHRAVLLSESPQGLKLFSRPTLLTKQPGYSYFGDWIYVPTEVKLSKRPKLEYQIASAFDTQILATIQGAWPETAWILLRGKDPHAVDLWKLVPQMQDLLEACIETLGLSQAPEVFISRNRCNLCHWFNHCYRLAQQQEHLSLVPGVTPSRYPQLQALNFTTVQDLASAQPHQLERLPGFGKEVAQKLVRQAQSLVQNKALLIPQNGSWNQGQQPQDGDGDLAVSSSLLADLPTGAVELYFDIEAEPELNLAYLLGVLVVDRHTNTDTFYELLAERPEDEPLIWQQFLDLVWQYPEAPIFHFCPYEAQTVERLAKLYSTPLHQVKPLLTRFIDLHEQVTNKVTLPIESYALKHIARWLGFNWRDPSANGAQTICWYTDWLESQDRSYLEAIARYNEDDCRAMYHLKDWLVGFLQPSQPPI
ncbi:MAG: TM0106 family RecB-like putative nuclease [Leptolyngbyaceae bacterium]|nr:TM0106 family RecB-like putative nuclease [Leptolyngbyaceae bacterium]